MLAGGGDGDNSILCLTYLAGSMNRIVAKLQRERIMSAIKLADGLERADSNIDAILAKNIASSDIQFKRTQETIRLLNVHKSCSKRSKDLMQDGIEQFQFVYSKLQAQRDRILEGCASLPKSSAEETTVHSPLQSWCARYHLVSAGETGYSTFIERLICWVALATGMIPHMGATGDIANHHITQAGCVLVMAFKEQLSRERAFLASKSRSLMLTGGTAEKVFSILDSTRTSILDAMKVLVSGPEEGTSSHSPLAAMEKSMGIDFNLDVPWSSKEEDNPPIVDMLHKLDDLQLVLRDEESTLPAADEAQAKSPRAESSLQPSTVNRATSKLQPSTVYMA